MDRKDYTGEYEILDESNKKLVWNGREYVYIYKYTYECVHRKRWTEVFYEEAPGIFEFLDTGRDSVDYCRDCGDSENRINLLETIDVETL